MYAIIKTGGKQYRVKKGDFLDVELLGANPGDEVEFGEVLFLSNGKEPQVGSPFIQGVTVRGKVVETVFGPKITAVKYRPRHNERRKFGHRQKGTRIEILAVGSQHKEKHHGA